jgi:hypothetical protein
MEHVRVIPEFRWRYLCLIYWHSGPIVSLKLGGVQHVHRKGMTEMFGRVDLETRKGT